MTRYATIPVDGGWAVFPGGGRHAVGVADPNGSALSFLVADPDGHPFDGSPLALLGPSRVEELRDALTGWLERTA